LTDLSVEALFELAKQLEPDQRWQLARRLADTISPAERDQAISHSRVADHTHTLLANPSPNAESLFGRFAAPDAEWLEQDMEIFLRHTGQEWEQEVGELNDKCTIALS
jgi:hypothetical protein